MSKIKELLAKWKQATEDQTIMDNTMASTTIPSKSVSSMGSTYIPTPAPAPNLTIPPGSYLTSTGYGTAWNTAAGTAYINPTTYNVTFTIPPVDILKLQTITGKDIVRVTQDGEVIWADPEMNENEAAQALTRSMQQSAELKAGITKTVKSKMRDTVFEEIINIAKQKGSLTADDLTYLLEASKIIEKLKGG